MRKFLFQLACCLYPIVILGALLLCSHRAHAGHIRKMPLSQDQPGVVKLALGHTTAISFPSKPEKLVLGSPGKVQVDFLNKDVTVSPVARNPGNLLIYTKGSRYVILFQIVSDSQYDDVVEITPGRSVNGHPIRLLTDTYHLAPVQIELVPKEKGSSVSESKSLASLTNQDRILQGEEFFDVLRGLKKLRCEGCVVNMNSSSIACLSPISKELRCRSSEYREIRIRKEDP